MDEPTELYLPLKLKSEVEVLVIVIYSAVISELLADKWMISLSVRDSANHVHALRACNHIA